MNENTHGQKVCEGCEAVVAALHVFCPRCNGYHFDAAPDRVRATLALRRLRKQLEKNQTDRDCQLL